MYQLIIQIKLCQIVLYVYRNIYMVGSRNLGKIRVGVPHILGLLERGCHLCHVNMAVLRQNQDLAFCFLSVAAYKKISWCLLVAWSKHLEQTAHDVGYQCCELEVVQYCPCLMYQDV